MVQEALNPVAFLDPSVLKFNLSLLELLTIRFGGVVPQALTIGYSSSELNTKIN